MIFSCETVLSPPSSPFISSATDLLGHIRHPTFGSPTADRYLARRYFLSASKQSDKKNKEAEAKTLVVAFSIDKNFTEYT